MQLLSASQAKQLCDYTYELIATFMRVLFCSVQLMGRPWAEATLLQCAAALEQQMLEDGIPHPVPSLSINPIECAAGVHPKARELAQKLWAKRYKK